jgi:hypothetical protein
MINFLKSISNESIVELKGKVSNPESPIESCS